VAGSGEARSAIRPEQVRLVRIIPEGVPGRPPSPAAAGARPVVRICIPEAVWSNLHFLYVGIEVFLPFPGAGAVEDHEFAESLVRLAVSCAAEVDMLQ
jgi:hypothetical protein